MEFLLRLIMTLESNFERGPTDRKAGRGHEISHLVKPGIRVLQTPRVTVETKKRLMNEVFGEIS